MPTVVFPLRNCSVCVCLEDCGLRDELYDETAAHLFYLKKVINLTNSFCSTGRVSCGPFYRDAYSQYGWLIFLHARRERQITYGVRSLCCQTRWKFSKDFACSPVFCASYSGYVVSDTLVVASLTVGLTRPTKTSLASLIAGWSGWASSSTIKT